MKQYSTEEQIDAKEKLPLPVSDFLSSETITNLYVGIIEKLDLNVRQGETLSQIANLTLLGLEPEHAFETNLHQELPELSNEVARELAADINDRVFKEAQRRLEQNIIEPKPAVDEREVGTKQTKEEIQEYNAQEKEEREHPVSDKELRKLADEETRVQKEKEDAEEAEAAKTRALRQQFEVKTTPGTEGTDTALAPVGKPVTIAEENLAAPEEVGPEPAQSISEVAARDKNEIQGIPEETAAPAARVIATPLPPAGTKYVGGKDPYREPIE